MPLSERPLLERTRGFVGLAVLVLAAIALTAEMLPEVEAKIITIPALALAIILGGAELLSLKRAK
jgi:hypothetical protein